MVLFIVALLLGGLLVPLATQLEGRQRAEAQQELQEIKEALIGYAIMNGKLPCYATDTDGKDAVDEGQANCAPGNELAPPAQYAAVTCYPRDYYLPWSTLGLNDGLDPWNQYWRYRVDQEFANPEIPSIGDNVSDQVSIQELDSTNSVEGGPVYIQKISSEYPIAVVYSTGANQVADYENCDYEEPAETPVLYEAGPVSNLSRDDSLSEDEDKFDDMLIWLSRPEFFYKLVSAEVLP